MTSTSIQVWFVGWLLATVAHALDPIVVAHGQFVHRETQRTFKPVGFSYQNSNDTSNPIDTLSNPTSCLRDAALFQQLGVNAISVSFLSVDASHDECMSIFNSVGIYVSIGFDEFELSWEGPGYEAYNAEEMGRAFRIIDAFKDYENVLGFSILNGYSYPERYAEYQPYVRAMIRDVKQYISLHTDRKDFPVGFSRDLSYDNEPGFVRSSDHLQYALDYARCEIPDGPEEDSKIDFLGFGVIDIVNATTSETVDPSLYVAYLRNLTSSEIPLLVSRYRAITPVATIKEYEPIDNFTLTELLYGDQSVTAAGGFVDSWANFIWTGQADYGLVELDEAGNIRLRPGYNEFQQALGQLNLDELRNGAVPSMEPTITTCSPTGSPSAVIDNIFGELETNTFNNSWALPTPPPEVQSMIESGVGGSRGTHVMLTQTIVDQTVRDATGNIMTGLAITPAPGTAIVNKSDRALKIGLGVGIPAVLLSLAVAALLIWRRRKHRTTKRLLTPPVVELPTEPKNGNVVLEIPPGQNRVVLELPGQHTNVVEMSGQHIIISELEGDLGRKPAELKTDV